MKYHMNQRNKFRQQIESGGVVFGARATTFSPTMIEVFGELGLDFVWLDFEHGGPSPRDSTLVENLTRAAEVGGTELLMRIPAADPPLIRKVLDAGIRNLLVPRVDTANEVRRAVEATRFVYDGEPGARGSASGRASTWGNTDGYVATEDDSVCIGVMIEKPTALDNIEEILSVPDLGFVFIGPGDLSIQLGHPLDRNHPAVIEAVEQIQNACQSFSVPMGGIAHDPESAIEAAAEGYQIIRVGGEREAAQESIEDRLTRIRELQGTDTG